MGEIKEITIVVFLLDSEKQPIAGATVRGFDGDEECAYGSSTGSVTEPVRLQLSSEYEGVDIDLLAEAKGFDAQRATVSTSVGTFTFNLNRASASSVPHPSPIATKKEDQAAMKQVDLQSLGKIAGLSGIALGVFALVFSGVLETRFLPQFGLTQEQAYRVIVAVLIFTFGAAIIGLIAHLIGKHTNQDRPAPMGALVLLSVLMIVVLGASVAVFAGIGSSAPDSKSPAVDNGKGKEPAPTPPAIGSQNSKSPVVPPVNTPVRKTGDQYIDRVQSELARLRSVPPGPTESQILSALAPLLNGRRFRVMQRRTRDSCYGQLLQHDSSSKKISKQSNPDRTCVIRSGTTQMFFKKCKTISPDFLAQDSRRRNTCSVMEETRRRL
jgi:hypothetical protein